jgi:hypothetical protein
LVDDYAYDLDQLTAWRSRNINARHIDAGRIAVVIPQSSTQRKGWNRGRDLLDCLDRPITDRVFVAKRQQVAPSNPPFLCVEF